MANWEGRKSVTEMGQVYRRGGGKSGLVGLAVFGALLVAVLVVVTPWASAVSPSSAISPAAQVKIKAPYNGPASVSWMAYGSGKCGYHASYPRTPAFNNLTGLFHGSVNASAVSCGGVPSVISASVSGEAEELGVTLSRGGMHIILTWMVKYTVKLHSTALAYAESGFEIEAYVYDVTTGAGVVEVRSFGDNYTSPSGGSVVGTFVRTTTVTANGTFVAGDVYDIYAYIDGNAYASADPGTASAYAFVNLGTHGDFAKLTSIKVP